MSLHLFYVAFRHILLSSDPFDGENSCIEQLTASRSPSGYKVHSTSLSDFLLYHKYILVFHIVVVLIAADTTVSAYFLFNVHLFKLLHCVLS